LKLAKRRSLQNDIAWLFQACDVISDVEL
jgi:hypothetical protein